MFVKVDVDKAKDVAQKYSVRSMPTFMFFVKGSKVCCLHVFIHVLSPMVTFSRVQVDEFSGANVAKLQQTVEKLVKESSRMF